jgi:pimeloyl-ACP methyl ester carboxylesterase
MSTYVIDHKLIVKEHTFRLPLDYYQDGHEEDQATLISVFARELRLESTSCSADMMVYFQGGPGFECPRLHQMDEWLYVLLKANFRVLLLDQRGTGLSTAITDRALEGTSTAQQLRYLTCFRADSIVEDAERIRKNLLGEQKWLLLGQSYGGFCAVCYLSKYPESLKAVWITGGLPPFIDDVADIYRCLFPKVISMNQHYYQRYPDDVKKIKMIAQYLADHSDTRTPNGGRLTVQKFLQLGLLLGVHNGWEELHCMVTEAFDKQELSYQFLHTIEGRLPFDTHPLYAVLHEAIYCHQSGLVSNWAAYRAFQELPEVYKALFLNNDAHCVYFTGEMVFPWMYEDYIHLQEFKQVAEILAQNKDWANLYDEKQLERNQVPCAAIIYEDDMYVSIEHSLQSIKKIRNMNIHQTKLYMHSGLRDAGKHILQLLSDLVQPMFLSPSFFTIVSAHDEVDDRDDNTPPSPMALIRQHTSKRRLIQNESKLRISLNG